MSQNYRVEHLFEINILFSLGWFKIPEQVMRGSSQSGDFPE